MQASSNNAQGTIQATVYEASVFAATFDWNAMLSLEVGVPICNVLKQHPIFEPATCLSSVMSKDSFCTMPQDGDKT